MRRRFPRALVPGDTVGLIAPASPIFEPERRDAAAALLRDMGFRVLRGESVDAVDHCFSGTDELRARDVNAMFADDGVNGIVCLRGGYGSVRLLPMLDTAAIARHPKPFVGFSDITALHAALYRTCGLVTFHGPMPGVIDPIGLRNPADRVMWLDVLSGKDSRKVQNPDGAPFLARGTRSVTGRLIGGNLSVLCSLIGTPWEPDWNGALLLLEDVAERADRLDGMATQLQEHGVLDRISGLVLGDFSRYEGMTSPRQLPLSRLITDHCPPELPILFGLRAGHGRCRMTLALGAAYRLNPRNASLTRLEAAVRL